MPDFRGFAVFGKNWCKHVPRGKHASGTPVGLLSRSPRLDLRPLRDITSTCHDIPIFVPEDLFSRTP